MNPQNPEQSPDPQEVAQKVGETTVVQGDVVEIDPAIVPEAAPQTNEKTSDDESKSDDADKPKDDASSDKSKPLLAGLAAADLLKAPVKPPEHSETEGKELTSNNKVKLLVAIGIFVFILGLLLLFVNLFLGILVALIAAGVIAFAVFAPVK